MKVKRCKEDLNNGVVVLLLYVLIVIMLYVLLYGR